MYSIPRFFRFVNGICKKTVPVRWKFSRFSAEFPLAPAQLRIVRLIYGKEGHNERQDGEKSEVDRRKQEYVGFCFLGIIFRKFAEGDQAGKRRNECADAADIDAHEQITVIFGKLREQNRRGNVGNELAGNHGRDQRIA